MDRAVEGNRMTVHVAHQAVLTAKAGVTQAEAALSEALDARDHALAGAGWAALAVCSTPVSGSTGRCCTRTPP
jgi:hypothetical protein